MIRSMYLPPKNINGFSDLSLGHDNDSTAAPRIRFSLQIPKPLAPAGFLRRVRQPDLRGTSIATCMHVRVTCAHVWHGVTWHGVAWYGTARHGCWAAWRMLARARDAREGRKFETAIDDIALLVGTARQKPRNCRHFAIGTHTPESSMAQRRIARQVCRNACRYACRYACRHAYRHAWTRVLGI